MSVQLHLIAHNLRSCENVGALLRTADALGVAQVWLTGYTPTPIHPKVLKTALGAEKSVVWTTSSLDTCLTYLRGQSIPIYALERMTYSQDIATFSPPPRLALLLGTETTGVSPSLLSKCTGTLSIAQHGVKESMNVAIAAAIACWAILTTRP